MQLTREKEPETKLNKLDYWLIAGLTLVYLVFALINLGSFKAPETYWQPANAGESFYVDLGSEQTIKKINTFGGPGDGNFDVDFSIDLKTWHDARAIIRNGGVVFAWTSMDIEVKAKYVRVTSTQPGFRLNEIALYGEDTSKPLHVEIVVPGTKSELSKGRPSYVFDEPDQAAFKPSYLNSTYFDEIYHARTAYEQLHAIEPYESTHPPLGKIIIGFGTAVFGMNPFGWRIMGTLFGVAMIPIFYAFGKQLFRKTEYAFMGAFLLTFDLMHFVQTRISTIDVYGVFFIILMYYYMYKYYRLSFYNTPLRKTLTPLALSGLFFGLGAASKWIALYAGAGLAVIFLLVLFERYREYESAKKLLVTKHIVKKENITQSYYRQIIGAFKPHLIKTVAWCLLFFVVIPGVIYVLSYIPFMQVPGSGHGLHDVWTYQKHMYDYHKNLKATHPFSSTWYQWPIMQKPLWYYGGQVPAGKVSLIVALGNPAVWWVGIVAIFSTLWIGLKKKDKTVLFLFIAMVANYVPWMLVARLTFIYHFFAMLPFMIFCIVYVIRHLKEVIPSQAMKGAVVGYHAIVLLLFLMFYPILSGAVVSRSYVDHFLKWFHSWIF
ncbi:MAG: glycosyltransferase family 39 protein [Paenibacillaceae bacterium]